MGAFTVSRMGTMMKPSVRSVCVFVFLLVTAPGEATSAKKKKKCGTCGKKLVEKTDYTSCDQTKKLVCSDAKCWWKSEVEKTTDRSLICEGCEQQYMSLDALHDHHQECTAWKKDHKPSHACPDYRGPTRSRANASSKTSSGSTGSIPSKD